MAEAFVIDKQKNRLRIRGAFRQKNPFCQIFQFDQDSSANQSFFDAPPYSLTGLPFTGPIPVSWHAQALRALYPVPNLPASTRYNYQTQVLTGTRADNLQSRLDKGFGRRDQIYSGFAFRSVRSDSEHLFHFRDIINTLGIDANINWSYRLPHQTLLLLTYRFSRFRMQVRYNFANALDVSGNAGITGNEQSPPTGARPTSISPVVSQD